MNQIEFQRLVIREEMYESKQEKIIDLSLQIARRPDNWKKRNSKAAVNAHAPIKHI